MDIKLESEWLPDGEDQWGHQVNAEIYRVDNVDPVIKDLKLEVDSWKATAETFEDFYRKTEVQCDGLEVEVTHYLEQIEQMQSELTKARELIKKVKSHVSRLCKVAGSQPSIATGYMRDVLELFDET